jgi:hypothetical protein
MVESRETLYLRQVLALVPHDEAEAILRLRRDFLEPSDLVVAHVIDDDDIDARSRMLRLLADVRLDFWTMPAEQLQRQLTALQRAGNAETAAAAARLQHVAAERPALLKLRADPHVHPAFIETLTRVFLSPAADANRLREREQRWMRPSTNTNYKRARHTIQATVRVIRASYPGVFALEEAWLSELLEYNPEEEVESEGRQQLFGCLLMVLVMLALFAMYAIVRGIFS